MDLVFQSTTQQRIHLSNIPPNFLQKVTTTAKASHGGNFHKRRGARCCQDKLKKQATRSNRLPGHQARGSMVNSVR